MTLAIDHGATATADQEVTSAVVVESLTKDFGSVPVLDDLDLHLARGEFVALLGASGSGKTTLLRILAGLEVPTRGEVWVPPSCTVVYQEARLVPSKRAWQNVVVGLEGSRRARRAAARRALDEVGLGDKGDAWPATLSGGQAQRVALARALVREPALLLLDEPFAALDALTRLRMHDLVQDLCARHRPATLLVTHDVDEAIALADRVAVLVDGKIALDEPMPPGEQRQDRELHAGLRQRLLAALGLER